MTPFTSHPEGLPRARRLVVAVLFGIVLGGPDASVAPAATILPDGLLEIGGEPFFPVGLVDIGYWEYPDDWNDRIRQSQVNVVWDIESAYADTIPTCVALLDSARATGYRLILGSGDTWNWDDPATPELEVDKLLYETVELSSLLQCVGKDPGRVIGFSNRDEPAWTISRGMIGDVDSAHIAWTYQQLHTEVPGTLVAMNFAPAHLSGDLLTWMSDLVPYLDATDVVMFASYPYPAGPGTCGSWNVLGYPDCTMDRLPLSADVFLHALNKPGQPLWMILQAHKSIPYREASWEAHAAIVHGATGLFWAGWTWSHILGNGRDSWPVISRVTRETSRLQKYLVGTDLPVRSDNPDVEVRALKANGKRIAVFAISRNGFAGTASIRLPNLPNGGNTTVRVLHEQRILVGENGWVTDTFQPYSSHVYEYQGIFDVGFPTSTPDVNRSPGSFTLRAYPNPSSGRTVTRFEVPRDAAVIVTVYDATGRRVALAGRGNYAAGTGEIVWNGRDLAGRPVAPGVYFLRGKTSDGATASARVLIRR